MDSAKWQTPTVTPGRTRRFPSVGYGVYGHTVYDFT